MCIRDRRRVHGSFQQKPAKDSIYPHHIRIKPERGNFYSAQQRKNEMMSERGSNMEESFRSYYNLPFGSEMHRGLILFICLLSSTIFSPPCSEELRLFRDVFIFGQMIFYALLVFNVFTRNLTSCRLGFAVIFQSSISYACGGLALWALLRNINSCSPSSSILVPLAISMCVYSLIRLMFDVAEWYIWLKMKRLEAWRIGSRGDTIADFVAFFLMLCLLQEFNDQSCTQDIMNAVDLLLWMLLAVWFLVGIIINSKKWLGQRYEGVITALACTLCLVIIASITLYFRIAWLHFSGNNDCVEKSAYYGYMVTVLAWVAVGGLVFGLVVYIIYEFCSEVDSWYEKEGDESGERSPLLPLSEHGRLSEPIPGRDRGGSIYSSESEQFVLRASGYSNNNDSGPTFQRQTWASRKTTNIETENLGTSMREYAGTLTLCLLYTSPSPRDQA
eukprot:TRINITY_DN10822_c0_g1_i3.p1 TRINITY_DN10822_c0_g1~~TRINITY_DN10822_c0_g1_i3.p1  ORF type:complete len:461 (+),score=38.95 TRINITY_DN10822_c0_g1_i3:49-1383(+)